MTQDEKILTVKALCEDDPELTDTKAGVYLAFAAAKMRDKIYPFNPNRTDIPCRYDFLQCQLASRLWYRRGMEGELQNTEAGTTRRYASVDDSDILNQLTPYCGVL